MKRVWVWESLNSVSSLMRLKSLMSQSTKPVTKPARSHQGKSHTVSQPVCVMLEPVPVHKENLALRLFPFALWFTLLATSLQWHMLGHKHKYSMLVLWGGTFKSNYVMSLLFNLIFVLCFFKAALLIVVSMWSNSQRSKATFWYWI